MRLVFVAALLLTGCLEPDDPGPGVVGTRADMTTPPGDYAGYRVVTECSSHFGDAGVIGIGSIALTQIADISAAAEDLHTRVTDLASVWGWGGYGLACESGIGTQIYLSDWRDVDTIIARTGEWLREHDYALQVVIDVSGVPVPQVGD